LAVSAVVAVFSAPSSSISPLATLSMAEERLPVNDEVDGECPSVMFRFLMFAA
jgi:hypothetical protein